jgi:hypothetical protein
LLLNSHLAWLHSSAYFRLACERTVSSSSSRRWRDLEPWSLSIRVFVVGRWLLSFALYSLLPSKLISFFSLSFLFIALYLFVDVALKLSQALVCQLIEFKFKNRVVIPLALQAFLNNWHNFLLLLLSEQAYVVL